MRTKDEILQGEVQDLKQTTSPDQAQIIQTGLLLEVLIDIRDELTYLAEAIDTNTHDIARALETITHKEDILQAIKEEAKET